MKKITVVVICVLFLTAGYALAQENDTMANATASNKVNMQVPMENNMEEMDNIENEAINDEGYGTDDEEYYGSENEMSGENGEEPMMDNADMPMMDNMAKPESKNSAQPSSNNTVDK